MDRGRLRLDRPSDLPKSSHLVIGSTASITYTPGLLTSTPVLLLPKKPHRIHILLSLLTKTQCLVTMSPGNSDELFLSGEGGMRGVLNGFQSEDKELFGEREKE